MPVNRCVCHDITFAEILRLTRDQDLSIDQIADKTAATTGCGTCLPYIKLALALRKDELPVMSPTQLQEAIEQTKRANT